MQSAAGEVAWSDPAAARTAILRGHAGSPRWARPRTAIPASTRLPAPEAAASRDRFEGLPPEWLDPLPMAHDQLPPDDGPSDHEPAGADVPIDEQELKDLLARAANGEDDAWRALHDKYSTPLLWVIRERIPSRQRPDIRSESLVQSAFHKMVQKLLGGEFEFRTKRGFESWINTIVVNELTDLLRRRGRQLQIADLAEGDVEAVVDERTEEGSPSARGGAGGRSAR